MDSFQSQKKQSEKIIRELKSLEQDMTETIRSKDTQLGVLRVKFTELSATKDKEIESNTSESNGTGFVSPRIFKDNSISACIKRKSESFESELVTNLF